MKLTAAEQARFDQQLARMAELVQKAVVDMRVLRSVVGGTRTSALSEMMKHLGDTYSPIVRHAMLGAALDILADHPELDDPGIPGIDVTGDAGEF